MNILRASTFVILLIGLTIPLTSTATPTFANAHQPNLPDVARGVPKGGALRVANLDLDQFGYVDLELERFTVFAPDATILTGGELSASPPKNIYFRGHANGLPNSIVVLTVPEKGNIRGLITDKNGVWTLAGKSGKSAPGLINRKIRKDELANLPPFECGSEALQFNVAELSEEPSAGAALDTASLTENVTHTARIAVETDYEYFAKFGDTAAALDYMGDLFAYSSAVYGREVNTNLVINWTRLWPDGAASDPWNANSGTGAALDEFLNHWNSNMTDVDRTVAHMLSGKALGGGVAYVSVLCNNSYGYGVSASLNGNFDFDSPSVVWDVIVVSHELGHNFSSRHTQDYCGNDGIDYPVDLCYNSNNNCGSALGLPGAGSLSGGTTAERPGTIMSYCHQLSGGLSNISFTLGLDHIYGIAADRVPATMRSHVLNRAAAYPGCLTLINPDLTNIDPTAEFTYSASDLAVSFTDTSSDSDGSIVSYAWNFGDGSSATVQNPSHTYSAAGSYTVTLEVTDNEGASDTATHAVTVSAPVLQPPAAPGNLTKIVQQTGKGKKKVISSVTLNWMDNSNNETGFVVESCLETTTGKGKNRVTTCNFEEYSRTEANITTLSVRTESGYRYRLKAFNAAGESAYSNEVKI